VREAIRASEPIILYFVVFDDGTPDLDRLTADAASAEKTAAANAEGAKPPAAAPAHSGFSNHVTWFVEKVRDAWKAQAKEGQGARADAV